MGSDLTQLNSTKIQRKEAEGAYINPRSLKKKRSILFLNKSNVPQLIIVAGKQFHASKTLIVKKIFPGICVNLISQIELFPYGILFLIRDARIPFFNIRILSVSVKNYPYPYPIRSDVVNCYPYPIRIRGSIMVYYGTITPRVKKNSTDILDCSFKIGCQILIVFLAQVHPILTQHQTMAFHFMAKMQHCIKLNLNKQEPLYFQRLHTIPEFRE